MSGESIYGLYAATSTTQESPKSDPSPYTGKYDKHLGEPTKPTYSTFFEKGKEYDGTNVRFFKQREAVIGKNVGDDVDPSNFLKKGCGIRHLVPTVHEEKIFCKPPLDHNKGKSMLGSKLNPDGDSKGANGAGGLPHDSRDGCNGIGTSGAGGSSGGNGANGSAGSGDGSLPPLPYGAGGAGGVGGVGYGNNAPGYGYGNAAGLASGDNGHYRSAQAESKNFVASNIIEASNMVPKRRKEQPEFATSRKSFGSAPAYLSRVKSEVQKEKEFVHSLEAAKVDKQEQMYAKYVYLLPKEEHRSLVQQLQRRHDVSLAELRSMPFSKDTATMRKHKADLEKLISDVETALVKLNKEAIFVYRDDPVNVQWTKEAALKEAQRYAAESQK